eukprot:7386957-Prymnesium_polylepis.3
MRALLRSEYRPRVITIEYNSNFPWGYPLAFPDPANMTVPGRQARWNGDCYMGSSAMAIDMAARELGYVTVDVEPGLDLFLVRADLWGSRPVPDLAKHKYLSRPFNLQKKGPHGGPWHPMPEAYASQLVDYSVYAKRESFPAAQLAAKTLVASLRTAKVPCFTPRPSGCELKYCSHLYSFLCRQRGAVLNDPCLEYPLEFPQDFDRHDFWMRAEKMTV